MARPFYPHEANDPDLDWLVSTFLCDKPDFIPVESGTLPLILLPFQEAAEEVKTPVKKQRQKEAPLPAPMEPAATLRTK